MSDRPQIVLSAFGDEAANHKSAVEQFAALSALGLQYYSLRFIDVGSGIKNVMKLTKAEITKLRHLEDEFGMNVASIGSPLGKVKLRDEEDGTKNQYVPFDQYLEKDVKLACELAHAFETKLIRGFSFYHPKGSDPREHLSAGGRSIGADCRNLPSQRSYVWAGDRSQPGRADGRVDGGAASPGESSRPGDDLRRRQHHQPGLQHRGMFSAVPGDEAEHRLDAHQGLPRPAPHRSRGARRRRQAEVLRAGQLGDSGHERILRDFAEVIPQLEQKLTKRGIPGVILDLEPHLKGGGQFGGFSGPDGMGVAVRGLCRVLDHVGIDYHLRDFDDVRAARGF